MRAPPPVDYPSALTRTWRTLLALAVTAGVASCVGWLLPYIGAARDGGPPDAWLNRLADPVIDAGLAVAIGGLCGLLVWRGWKSGAAHEPTLRWDAQDWVLVDAMQRRPDQRGDVVLMLDLGAWMLVHFKPHGARGPGLRAGHWLPLALAGDPARWAALRGALWNWRAVAGAGRP